MGNRFKGGIAPGAMPPLHRYLGNPVLSFVGRLFFRSKAGDFHCGLRAFNRQSAWTSTCTPAAWSSPARWSSGRPSAATTSASCPTTLRPDGRSRPPHLHTWRDGWRHLRFLVALQPPLAVRHPRLVLMALGLAVGIRARVRRRVGSAVSASTSTPLVLARPRWSCIGLPVLEPGLLTKLYAVSEGFLPADAFTPRLRRFWTLGEGSGRSVGVLALLGLAGLLASLVYWNGRSFGDLDPRESLRIVVPAATALDDEHAGGLLGAVRQHPADPAPTRGPRPGPAGVRQCFVATSMMFLPNTLPVTGCSARLSGKAARSNSLSAGTLIVPSSLGPAL